MRPALRLVDAMTVPREMNVDFASRTEEITWAYATLYKFRKTFSRIPNLRYSTSTFSQVTYYTKEAEEFPQTARRRKRLAGTRPGSFYTRSQPPLPPRGPTASVSHAEWQILLPL